MTTLTTKSLATLAKPWTENALVRAQAAREGGFPEFKLGDNAFLYLIDPTALGSTFQAPHGAPIALRVADVAETRKELEARGIEFVNETYDSGVCHMAPFADPDGNRFMLHRRYAPVEE